MTRAAFSVTARTAAVVLCLAAAAAAAPLAVRVPRDADRPDLPPSSALRGGDPGCAGAPVLSVAPGLDTVLTGDTTGGVSAVDGYGCV
ncbi:MAG: hypothetical protein Q7W29_08530, partial [bacterium]|nr:hypothetical protein [bacterium]